jgi:preprotein translocase subunit SecB
MTLSPLQLRRYFVEEIYCKANSNFEKNQETAMKNFHVSFETSEDSNPFLRSIKLTVEQKPTKDGNEPYHFKVVLVGLFEIMSYFFESHGPEKTEQLINVNGPAILYSSARELLALISARGPYTEYKQDILLPSISFMNFKPIKSTTL